MKLLNKGRGMKVLSWAWGVLKVPLMIVLLCFYVGLGISLGVANSDTYQTLLSGRAIIITSVDLNQE